MLAMLASTCSLPRPSQADTVACPFSLVAGPVHIVVEGHVYPSQENLVVPWHAFFNAFGEAGLNDPCNTLADCSWAAKAQDPEPVNVADALANFLRPQVRSDLLDAANGSCRWQLDVTVPNGSYSLDALITSKGVVACWGRTTLGDALSCQMGLHDAP